METTLVRAEQVVWETWGRNYGQACDYFVVPGLQSEDSFLLSFGLATIDTPDCAFSHFSGMERLHYLLAGETELEIQGVSHQLTQSNPFVRFPGDVKTRCRVLRKPVTAFNVIANAQMAELIAPVVLTNQKVQIRHKANAHRHVFDFFLLLSGELLADEITFGASCFEPKKLSIGDALVLSTNCESEVLEFAIDSNTTLLRSTAVLCL